MAADRTLSLVLPAHNEAANLETVVRDAVATLPQHFAAYEVLIVDDGSRDATPALADRLAAEEPHVRVLHHPQNRGYGAALSTGFAAARGDRIMFMDSDRQFDIRDVAKLAPYAGEFDIVAGYRIKRNDPGYRFVIGYTFNTVVKLLFGVDLRDIDCGFKIFRAELLRGMDLQSPGALINTEIHAKANRQVATIVEIGVNHYPRLVGDQSGADIRVILRAMRETALLWWRMRAYEPPVTAARPAPRPMIGDVVVFGGVTALLGTVLYLALRRRGGR
jgi:glycosyltransferase involved in cell wall biosynthesis